MESLKNVSQYDGLRPNQKREAKENQGHSLPNGWLKVNVDAAVNAEKQVAGLGVVITDGNQNCITAAINTSRYFGNVAMAEAAAVKWGLQVALRVGGTYVLLESDCHEVVEIINNRDSRISRLNTHIDLEGFCSWGYVVGFCGEVKNRKRKMSFLFLYYKRKMSLIQSWNA